MVVKCSKCQSAWEVPADRPGARYKCGNCGAFLPEPTQPSGETSTAVGALGGAALGAAIAGPVGALVGGILGGLIGSQSKGLG
jgi:ribosomal protein S27E